MLLLVVQVHVACRVMIYCCLIYLSDKFRLSVCVCVCVQFACVSASLPAMCMCICLAVCPYVCALCVILFLSLPHFVSFMYVCPCWRFGEVWAQQQQHQHHHQATAVWVRAVWMISDP